MSEEIERIVGHLHTQAIQSWLRYKKYPYSAKNTEELYKNLDKWIQNGTVPIDDLRAAALEIEEGSSKKSYLLMIDDPSELRDKRTLTSWMQKKGVAFAKNPDASIRNPRKATLNYVYWDESNPGPVLRIKYSEMHEDPEVDLENDQIKWKKNPRFIIGIVDLKTGFVEIRFDKAGQRHEHKDKNKQSSEQKYELYYIKRIQDLLCEVEFKKYDFTSVPEYLVQKGRELFRINREESSVSGNGKQIYSISRQYDVRDLDARIGADQADGMNWITEDLCGYWIAGASNGQLQRDLFMRLSKRYGTVRFHRDCLSGEIDYAIRKIRDIKDDLSQVSG